MEKNKESCLEKFVSEASDILNSHSSMEVLFNKQELGKSTESSQVSSFGNARDLLAEKGVNCLRTEIDEKQTRRCSLVNEMSGSHYRKLLAEKPAANYNTSNDKPLKVMRPDNNKYSSEFPSIGFHLNSLAATKDKIIVKRPMLTKEQKEGNISENSFPSEGNEFPRSSHKKRLNSDKLGETESCKRCNCKKSKCLKLYCECFANGLYCVEPCNCQDCFNKPIHKDSVLKSRQRIESRSPLSFAPKVHKYSGTPNNTESSQSTITKVVPEVGMKEETNEQKDGNVFEDSILGEGIEFSWSSQKERPNSDKLGETESCKKSKCLKLYCECFASGLYCVEPCNCQDCFNNSTHKDNVLECRQCIESRSPLAFAPKVIRYSGTPNNTVSSQSTITKVVPEVGMKEETSEKKDGNVSEDSIRGEGIEFSWSSQKERLNSDKLGKPESCKRCNCKKSKCLKLYCECFAAGLYCVEPCNCQDCFNNPIHKDTVLETRRRIESRNQLAFTPKVIKSSDTPNNIDELSKTPGSAHHKRDCNCKKSGCIKKYCVCFQGGVGCSLNCRCEGCKNIFGRKEGSESIVYNETKILRKNPSDVSSLDSVHGTIEENHDQIKPELSKNARGVVGT